MAVNESFLMARDEQGDWYYQMKDRLVADKDCKVPMTGGVWDKAVREGSWVEVPLSLLEEIG